MLLPDSIKKIADHFSDLPGIGPWQAIRLAIHLATQGKDAVRQFALNISELQNVEPCTRCFFLHHNTSGLCDICGDRNRNPSIIAILEKETDLLSIENTKKYNGHYFILGTISKTGILDEWQNLRLEFLKSRITKELSGKADEIIVAFNPNANGNFHALTLTKELAPFAKKISRLGRGLPKGGEIEFADDETLGSALERRS